MSGISRTTIQGPDGPLLIQFDEANDDQLLPCHELAGLAFRQPLSNADFVERENFMIRLGATQGGGSWLRIWCVFPVSNPTRVLASCKTIRRDLLVKESSMGETRDRLGYCISSVVVESAHRGLGVGAYLLASVKQWLDTEGGAALSMLYSSNEGFYEKNGWFPVPAPELSLRLQNSFLKTEWDQLKLPATRMLHEEDISPLCERDIEALRSEVYQRKISEGETLMTVLPTAELIRWLHGRAEFFGLKLFDKIPQNKGATCREDTWMVWHHDFRKRCLYIQRIRSFEKNEEQRIRCLAALFLDACREAETWELSKLVTWDTNDQIHDACELLRSLEGGVEVLFTEKRREIISIRAGSGERTTRLNFHLNEHFAWN